MSKKLIIQIASHFMFTCKLIVDSKFKLRFKSHSVSFISKRYSITLCLIPNNELTPIWMAYKRKYRPICVNKSSSCTKHSTTMFNAHTNKAKQIFLYILWMWQQFNRSYITHSNAAVCGIVVHTPRSSFLSRTNATFGVFAFIWQLLSLASPRHYRLLRLIRL